MPKNVRWIIPYKKFGMVKELIKKNIIVFICGEDLLLLKTHIVYVREGSVRVKQGIKIYDIKKLIIRALQVERLVTGINSLLCFLKAIVVVSAYINEVDISRESFSLENQSRLRFANVI